MGQKQKMRGKTGYDGAKSGMAQKDFFLFLNMKGNQLTFIPLLNTMLFSSFNI
jgi:hypothetical protein